MFKIGSSDCIWQQEKDNWYAWYAHIVSEQKSPCSTMPQGVRGAVSSSQKTEARLCDC